MRRRCALRSCFVNLRCWVRFRARFCVGNEIGFSRHRVCATAVRGEISVGGGLEERITRIGVDLMQDLVQWLRVCVRRRS